MDLFLDAARAAVAPVPEPQPEHDDPAQAPPSASCSSGSKRCRRLPACSRSTPGSILRSEPGGRWRSISPRRKLALAVEIDGYYHFQNADAYRRDRRKDFELQKQGFLVVRVLADDVVRRLEDVLDQILAAVASRRRP